MVMYMCMLTLSLGSLLGQTDSRVYNVILFRSTPIMSFYPFAILERRLSVEEVGSFAVENTFSDELRTFHLIRVC